MITLAQTIEQYDDIIHSIVPHVTKSIIAEKFGLLYADIKLVSLITHNLLDNGFLGYFEDITTNAHWLKMASTLGLSSLDMDAVEQARNELYVEEMRLSVMA